MFKKTFLFVAVVVFGLSVLSLDVEAQVEVNYDKKIIAIDYQDICEEAGGDYDLENGECGGVDQSTCQAIGGSFDSCASACRNDPSAQMCTLQCVKVCYLPPQDSKEDPDVIAFPKNFEECESLGGEVVESSPRQCFYEDTFFVEADSSQEGVDHDSQDDETYDGGDVVAMAISAIFLVALVAFVIVYMKKK